MGDLLRQGSQWLGAQLREHASSPVTYRRGEVELDVPATFGRTEYEVADDYGTTIRTHAVDFLILADAFWQEGFEPQAGDVVVAPSTGSGQATAFEVMDLAGQGCWRWSAPYRTTFRIHTKDTGPDQ